MARFFGNFTRMWCLSYSEAPTTQRNRAGMPDFFCYCKYLKFDVFLYCFILLASAVGHKRHDPCYHKKYMESGVMTFVTHRTHCIVVRRAAPYSANVK